MLRVTCCSKLCEAGLGIIKGLSHGLKVTCLSFLKKRKEMQLYQYKPVMLDMMDPKTKIKAGTVVVKTQLPGAPKNGVMGQCYIADPETNEFLGMVCVNSLIKYKPES
jgi:hypothetical protein